MQRLCILPYKKFSKAGKELSKALRARRISTSELTSLPKDSKVINWGCVESSDDERVLNKASIIRQSSNKKLFFQKMREKGLEAFLPPFWVDRKDIPTDVYPIVCRTVLAGHSGEGIVIAASPEEIVPASLYVQYKKKRDEFRIHVGKFEGESIIISTQQKKRRLDVEEPNWKVRNHQNGFIYARNELRIPPTVIDIAKKVLLASDLDFGAVDIIWNEEKKYGYCLEINTAPGLEGTTIGDYETFFRRFVEDGRTSRISNQPIVGGLKG